MLSIKRQRGWTDRQTERIRPPTAPGFLLWFSAHTTLIHLLICLNPASPYPRKWHHAPAIYPTTYCLQSPQCLLMSLSVSSQRLNPDLLEPQIRVQIGLVESIWMIWIWNKVTTKQNTPLEMSFIKACGVGLLTKQDPDMLFKEEDEYGWLVVTGFKSWNNMVWSALMLRPTLVFKGFAV